MSDLDLLNRLSRERDEAREEARLATLRAETAEKKLSAYITDGVQATKARQQRDEAVRLRRAAEKRAEVFGREKDRAIDAGQRLQRTQKELQDELALLRARNEELERKFSDVKSGAQTLERTQEAEIRRLRSRVAELEPLQEVIEALRVALKPFQR